MATSPVKKLEKKLLIAARALEEFKGKDTGIIVFINPIYSADPPCRPVPVPLGPEMQSILLKTAAWLRYLPTMLEEVGKLRVVPPRPKKAPRRRR